MQMPDIPAAGLRTGARVQTDEPGELEERAAGCWQRMRPASAPASTSRRRPPPAEPSLQALRYGCERQAHQPEQHDLHELLHWLDACIVPGEWCPAGGGQRPAIENLIGKLKQILADQPPIEPLPCVGQPACDKLSSRTSRPAIAARCDREARSETPR